MHSIVIGGLEQKGSRGILSRKISSEKHLPCLLEEFYQSCEDLVMHFLQSHPPSLCIQLQA